MGRHLLIGAGFSRNWGARVATDIFGQLLSLPAIGDHPRLRALLINHQSAGGFEYALSELQSRTDAPSQQDRRTLETALQLLFARINRNLFARNGGIEFQNRRRWMVREFLGLFDSIFTLNQDLLLEHHYVQHVELLSSRKWDGAILPYMRPIPSPDNHISDRRWSHFLWVPEEPPTLNGPNSQPIFKLHGSTNWRPNSASDLMILGGTKETAIQQQEVLSRYFREFRAAVCTQGARVCILGYGFGDDHVTRVLEHAMLNSALTTFLIDTAGIDAYRRVNRSHKGSIREQNSLEDAFDLGLRGVCARELREIFSGPNNDHDALMDFLGS